MRPGRFQRYTLSAYQDANLVAEQWSEGTSRPYGIRVRLPIGVEVWHAITTQPREGDQPDEPEEPVEKDAPRLVDVPELPTGLVPVATIEHYLAALLTNAGSPEIARVYSYTDREQRGSTAGFGVEFWSGAKAFAPFVHALRPGQTRSRGFALSEEI